MDSFKNFSEQSKLDQLMAQNNDKIYRKLSPRQKDFAEKISNLVADSSKYDKGAGKDGALYLEPGDNIFLDQNIRCKECLFFDGKNKCSIVQGAIKEDGMCRLWLIPESVIK